MLTYAAIVLAGGRSSRMGGGDKTAIPIEGIPMLQRVLDGVRDARSCTVVGPEVGGGPVAAIASALTSVEAPVVLTLAGDQPWIAPAVPVLVEAIGGGDVAVLVSDGRRHHLAAAWRTSALRRALAGLESVENASVRALFDGAAVAEIPDPEGWSRDIDSPEDLPD